MNTDTTIRLHASRQFDLGKLGPLSRHLLRQTSLSASDHNMVNGMTLGQVETLLEKGGIDGADAMSIKMDLVRNGILLPTR